MRSIPLKIQADDDIKDAGEILVDGLVDGKEYEFLLDTGCSMTSIRNDNYLESFAAFDTKKPRGAFGEITSDMIKIDHIKLGAISVKNHSIARVDKNMRRNLFGIDILKNYNLHFKFESFKIDVLDQDQEIHGLGFHDLSFSEQPMPHMYLEIEKQSYNAVWDTGAGVTCVNMAVIESHPSCFKQIGVTVGEDISGSKFETPIFEMKNLKIADREFSIHQVVGVDLEGLKSTLKQPFDFVIGVTSMRKADWLFDFYQKRYAITKTY